MTQVRLLEPANPDDPKKKYIPLSVQARIVGGNPGSTESETAALLPSSTVTLVTLSRVAVNQNWYVEMFDSFWRIEGIRRLPPFGVWMELIVYLEDTELDIVEELTIGGKTLTIGPDRLVI